MKRKNLIFVVLALIGLNSAMMAQQKYALLIAGDYKPGTEIPAGHKWNNGQGMDPVKGWDEFWNDTYLMWELLYDDPITNYSNDNITVLFAEGIDYTFPGQHERYKSITNHPEIQSITDGSATKANVMAALDNLAGIQEEDYLYVWIMSNGGNTQGDNDGNSFVYLWGYDPGNPNAGRLYDYELKAKLDLIPAHKKVVVVQAPRSGGFAQELSGSSTIVITSSTKTESASRANDTPYQENEWWDGIQYHHGEFGYHLYSPLRGEDPGYGSSYGSVPFTSANTYNDDVISFDEAIGWLLSKNNSGETVVVSDPGALSETTAIQYSTLMFGEYYENMNFIGTIGLTGTPPPVGQATTAIVLWDGNVTFSNAVLYFLDDTRLYKDGSNTDLLRIDNDVTLCGTESSSGLVTCTDIEIGTNVTFTGLNEQFWGGFAVQNTNLNLVGTQFIDCWATFNTIPNLTIDNCNFIRSGLIGQFLFHVTVIKNGTNFINSFADLSGYLTGTVVIEGCEFEGPAYNGSASGGSLFGISLDSFKDYSFTSNSVHGYGYGLTIYNSSAPSYKRDIFNNSFYNNYYIGICLNKSYANIFNNQGIYNNYVGIFSYNYSNVSIMGNENAELVSQTQCIFDNTYNQIRACLHSFPYLKWNAIWYNYNTEPLIYWDLGGGDAPPKDISNNFWGLPSYFDPYEDFYPTLSFNWQPVWNLSYGSSMPGDDELLYTSAITKAANGDYFGARSDYLQLIEDYSDSWFAEAAMKELLPLEENVSNDYFALRQYYLTDPIISGNTNLSVIGENLANWCYVKMGEYSTALQYCIGILANPPSYQDSVFALFDIDYINFLIDNNSYKSGLNSNPHIFNISAKEQQDATTDFYTGLLFREQNLSKQVLDDLQSLKPGKLIQNYPNPFNENTVILYKLDRPAFVTIKIFDNTGKLIKEIIEGTMSGGNHHTRFIDNGLVPGLYFYTLVTDGVSSDVKKMTIIK